jgi:hypothetical protein
MPVNSARGVVLFKTIANYLTATILTNTKINDLKLLKSVQILKLYVLITYRMDDVYKIYTYLNTHLSRDIFLSPLFFNMPPAKGDGAKHHPFGIT